MRAIEKGLALCSTCMSLAQYQPGKKNRCPCCGSRLHLRKPNSISKTWAYLLTAMMAYIPANTLPIMKTVYLGESMDSTIISGVIHFIHEGDWFLAVVIFTASILVPLLKMMSLLYLLISVQLDSSAWSSQRSWLYQITEWIGRWSMVDVFVIAILTALVQMGQLSQIEPGLGALAFASVVIFSILAASSFDPRLIWDQYETSNHRAACSASRASTRTH